MLLKLTVFVTAGVFCCSARHRLRRADAAVQYMHTYIHTYIQTYIHTLIHACMHTCIHNLLIPVYTCMLLRKSWRCLEATWCYWISVFSIVYLAGLLFGCKSITRTYSSTHNLLRTNPSPSLFSFLLSPCYLYLSFAACWKKLTCGVIRSFNFLPGHLGKTEATRNSGFILRLLV